jgi:hypothetical protein
MASSTNADMATPVMISRPVAMQHGGVQPVNLVDAQAQISCSLDNPEGCEACGS